MQGQLFPAQGGGFFNFQDASKRIDSVYEDLDKLIAAAQLANGFPA